MKKVSIGGIIAIIVAIIILIVAVKYLVAMYNANNKSSNVPTKPSEVLSAPFDCCGNALDNDGKPYDPTVTCNPPTDCVNNTNNNTNSNVNVSSNLDDAFTSQFWQNSNYNPSQQDKDLALLQARKVYDALGFFQTNHPDVIKNVLANAKTKAGVSLIADQFAQDNSFRGITLYSFLKANLKPEELKQVLSIVNNLPSV